MRIRNRFPSLAVRLAQKLSDSGAFEGSFGTAIGEADAGGESFAKRCGGHGKHRQGRSQ